MSNEGKYLTRNPLKRFLLERFLRRARRAVSELPGSVLDVGVGEGYFWQGLDSSRVTGVDVRADALMSAGERFGGELLEASILDLPFPDEAFESAAAIEILEHLDQPSEAVAELHRVVRSSVIVTTPWEPWFSLLVLLGSGRHWRRLGREPEHIQAFGPSSLHALLASRFGKVRVDTCFPWLIARAGK